MTATPSDLVEAAGWLCDPTKVEALLRAGVPPDGVASDTTPLIAACLASCSEAVEVLLRFGADPNRQDLNRQSPLIAAAGSGDVESVKMLLDRGAVVDWQNAEGMSALLVASRFGHLEVVRALLTAGASPILRCNRGGTALIWAMMDNDQPQIVALLLQSGADPQECEYLGRLSAIDFAGKLSRRKSLQVLLSTPEEGTGSS